MPSGPEERKAWRLLLADPMATVGLALVTFFIAMALFAPWVAPHDPLKISVTQKFQTPGLTFLAGTDQLGRDILSRIIFGARTAMGVSLASTGTAGAIGLLLGLIAG